ncbi:hypothetical protein D0860_03668 [Hortaea werneckii]|uniref:galacturonan 1,4-alpha-galacturonidase n=1 Tax=Hortaea werneckii TaxID=91943 RepID=A0A3M7HBY3_HORWE|nr:hypothetical protein D0860_03668 [Hortaea werneckii]
MHLALKAPVTIALSLTALTGVNGQRISHSRREGRPTCTVFAGSSNATDDVTTILRAFKDCGDGGNVVFPEGEQYHINSKLNPVVNDVNIEWRGEWVVSLINFPSNIGYILIRPGQFSENLTYWRNNNYHIEFQNHAAGFVLTGDHIWINGYGTGGIDGNGEVWYYAERGNDTVGATQPGRPIPFQLWNVSDVTIKNFHVVQPQLWAINMMNATDIVADNIYVNATSPQAPPGYNWVQNTDGFNTMDTRNVHLTNFVYQGGDDCVAIKPRSYNFYGHNITCISGNGIAIGSLGQYLTDASVENVVIDHATIIKGGAQGNIGNGAYIKTWVGELVSGGDRDYESDYQPQGGGWGHVTNMLFSNFVIHGAKNGAAITQNSGDNGTAAGTSNMLISKSIIRMDAMILFTDLLAPGNVAFANWTGYLDDRDTAASVSCSEQNPCYNIDYRNFTLYTSSNDTVKAGASCKWTEKGTVHGVDC